MTFSEIMVYMIMKHPGPDLAGMIVTVYRTISKYVDGKKSNLW